MNKDCTLHANVKKLQNSKSSLKFFYVVFLRIMLEKATTVTQNILLIENKSINFPMYYHWKLRNGQYVFL